MSMAALLLAVRDVLRLPVGSGGLGLRNAECDIMGPQGKPPAIAGEIFVAVHPGPWSGTDVEGLEEECGFRITLSARGDRVPYDRWGTDLLCKPKTGLGVLDRVSQIKAVLHLDVTGDLIINTANSYLNNPSLGLIYNGFVEPPRFRDGGEPQERSGSWWSAKSEEPLAGVSQTLLFTGVVRYQRIESMG